MICDIDEAQLDRELDALLLELPPDALEGELLQPQSDEWRKALTKFRVVKRAHKALVPGWEVDEEEGTEAAAELAQHIWPGGIGNADNWGPWAKFFFFLACTAAANFDDDKGEFRPIRPPELDADPQPKKEPANGEGN